MKIEKNMLFKGNVNNKIIMIIDANEKHVIYKCMETKRIFSIGRKAFEHCLLQKI